MSPRTAYQWRPVLEQYGFIILLAVAFLPIFPGSQTLFGEIFERIGVPIVNLLLGIDAFSDRRTSDWWAGKARQALATSGPACDRRSGTSWRPGSGRRSSPCSTRCTSPTGATASTSSRTLRGGGVTERDVLVAGLLHDCAKGDTGARAAGRVLAGPALRAVGLARRGRSCPGWRVALERLRDHAEASAELAAGGRLLARGPSS